MSGLYPGSVDLATRDERLPRLRTTHQPPDPRSAADYRAGLVQRAEEQLMRSARWRAGLALADHTGRCDCPHTAAGCLERRGWPRVGDLGGGRNLDSRQGRALERNGRVRWGQ